MERSPSGLRILSFLRGSSYLRTNQGDVMSRTMKKATETGLLICHTISPAGLKFIEEWDPDLHYEIMHVRKKRDRAKRRSRKK